MNLASLLLAALALAPQFCLGEEVLAEVQEAQITTGHSATDAGFSSGGIPAMAVNDPAARATFKVISGRPDANSSSLAVLKDGKPANNEDDAGSNFFFAPGDNGGRITVDLGKIISIGAVATYSWHIGERAPQRYTLFAARGDEAGFEAEPAADVSPESKGWRLVAKVDTTSKGAGQHSVSISGKKESLGDYRHLLFNVEANPEPNGFGNTFFSEIDVTDAKAQEPVRYNAPDPVVTTYKSKDGEYSIVVDSSASPDLNPWFEEKVVSELLKWYPKVVDLIVIPGKTPPAPKKFNILLKEGDIIPGRQGIPGFAIGDRIVVSSRFMRDERDGEAVGCLIHEMVHIAQFGEKPAHRSVPVWFFEGATDYIRWFLFEPQRNGAVIRNPDSVNYDDSYRTTANFIDWVKRTQQKDILKKIHIAIHEGYSKELWKTWTGKSVEELDKEWKDYLKKKNAAN